MPLFAGKLYRDFSSTKLSRGKKKISPASLALRVRSTRRPVFAQHRFPPIETSFLLAPYFPRIAPNVFAKIGLPLISLPTPPPSPHLSLFVIWLWLANKDHPRGHRSHRDVCEMFRLDTGIEIGTRFCEGRATKIWTLTKIYERDTNFLR